MATSLDAWEIFSLSIVGGFGALFVAAGLVVTTRMLPPWSVTERERVCADCTTDSVPPWNLNTALILGAHMEWMVQGFQR